MKTGRFLQWELTGLCRETAYVLCVVNLKGPFKYVCVHLRDHSRTTAWS